MEGTLMKELLLLATVETEGLRAKTIAQRLHASYALIPTCKGAALRLLWRTSKCANGFTAAPRCCGEAVKNTTAPVFGVLGTFGLAML
jgi:hypothetical protein